MTIWIAAVLFFGFAGMVGFYLGMVRVAFSLLGLIVAIMFALVAVTVNVIRHRQAGSSAQEG